jgi:hypothetical protein
MPKEKTLEEKLEEASSAVERALVAAPSRAEVSLDVSRGIDDIVESERAKWDKAYGKDAP